MEFLYGVLTALAGFTIATFIMVVIGYFKKKKQLKNDKLLENHNTETEE